MGMFLSPTPAMSVIEVRDLNPEVRLDEGNKDVRSLVLRFTWNKLLAFFWYIFLCTSLNLCSVNPFHFCSRCARPGKKLIYEQADERNLLRQGQLWTDSTHLGNLYLRQRSMVSSQSSHVSVGKPAMMSVTMVNPSTLSLRKSTTLQNSATVYSLRMSPSTASLPACKSISFKCVWYLFHNVNCSTTALLRQSHDEYTCTGTWRKR